MLKGVEALKHGLASNGLVFVDKSTFFGDGVRARVMHLIESAARKCLATDIAGTLEHNAGNAGLLELMCGLETTNSSTNNNYLSGASLAPGLVPLCHFRHNCKCREYVFFFYNFHVKPG